MKNEGLNIIKIYKEGNKHYAFNLMVKEYGPRLYQHIRRMLIIHEDTDDILQNTYLKAWRHLDSFREESELYTWLYRVATNEVLSFLKQKKRRFMLPIVNVERDLENKLLADENINGDEIQLNLQKAILSLPEKQRIVFNMRYYEDLSYKEISEILGTTEGGLKASYHHAAKKIEEFILNIKPL